MKVESLGDIAFHVFNLGQPEIRGWWSRHGRVVLSTDVHASQHW